MQSWRLSRQLFNTKLTVRPPFDRKINNVVVAEIGNSVMIGLNLQTKVSIVLSIESLPRMNWKAATLIAGLLCITMTIVAVAATFFALRNHISGRAEQHNFKLCKAMPAYRSVIIADSLQFSWEGGAERVLILGDSRVQQWQDLPVVDGHEFRKVGIGGETTSELLARISLQLSRAKPDKVIIQIGINDLAVTGTRPDLTQAIQKSIVTNLETIIGVAQRQEIEVVLMDIIRPMNKNFRGHSYEQFVEDLVQTNAEIERIAEKSGVSLLRVDEVFLEPDSSTDTIAEYYLD